jgi:sulfide:quinone oxidoreductase
MYAANGPVCGLIKKHPMIQGDSMPQSSARIVIVGAGFAALAAARVLRRQAPDAIISMLAPQAEFVYLPSLIWLPSGLRRGDDLRFPLQPFCERHRIDFIACTVTGLRDGGRLVVTDRGEVTNDALLIASGGRFIKALPGIEHALTLCEGIPAAEEISRRLAAMEGGRIAFGFGANPKEPAAMRGGPMFELLFGIDTSLRQQGRRERFELTFFNANPRPGQRLGARAVDGLLAEMAKRSIATQLGHKLLGFSEQGVRTEGGDVASDLILFMPGLTGPAWAADSGMPLSAGGFFQADEFCRVTGQERVFVAGDAGSFPGPDWLPKQAHMAELQARAAASNLLRALARQPPRVKPRAELLCVIDSVDAGIIVFRNENRSLVTPKARMLHWAKRYFEGHYLRGVR